MQITSDKWYGAPGGNQQDPDFNVGRGAQYFAGVLNGDAGGNVLLAVGMYNGWHLGMTKVCSISVLSLRRTEINIVYREKYWADRAVNKTWISELLSSRSCVS